MLACTPVEVLTGRVLCRQGSMRMFRSALSFNEAEKNRSNGCVLDMPMDALGLASAEVGSPRLPSHGCFAQGQRCCSALCLKHTLVSLLRQWLVGMDSSLPELAFVLATLM